MVALLALLYRKVDAGALGAVLADFRWRWLFLIYALFLANSAVSALKWQLLLRADGIRVRFPRLLASYLIGSFFNLFLPSNIGGDAYRVMETRRYGGAAKSFASVFGDRLTGFLALAVWGLVFSVFGWARLPDRRILVLPAAVFVLMAVTICVVVQRRALLAALGLMGADRLRGVGRFVHGVLDSVAVYRSNRVLVTRVFGISLLFQFVAILIVFSISRAMAWEVPFVHFSVFVPLIMLGEALPISVFGIGVRDGLYVFFFSQVGASREQALAMALAYVVLTIVYSLYGGVLFLLRRFHPPPAAVRPWIERGRG